MRNLIIIFCWLLLCCCKTNRIVNNEREGLWIEKEDLGTLQLKSKGRYKKGSQHKIWRYYQNGNLVKKEKYTDSICLITHFENRKKVRQGQAKLCISDTLSHWFYFGDWKTFDQFGKITEIDRYEEGQLISTEELLKQ